METIIERGGIILAHGRPGSGKDTQADLLLANELKDRAARKISTGEIIRGVEDPNSEYQHFYAVLGTHVEASKKGILIPDTVMVPVFRQAIAEKQEQGIRFFVVTGFPRTIGQLDEFDKADFGPTIHILFDVSDEIARERSGIRGRDDDAAHVVEDRLRAYREQTHPMVERLRDEGRLLVIDASGTKQAVRELTLKTLGFNSALV
jgi:adenylate kinase